MFVIEDYCIVSKGIKNYINQDNIYMNGLSLPERNDGINNYQKKIIKLKNKLTYGVFDGVGGLDKGEHASFLATNTLNSLHLKDNINDIIKEINKVICIEKENLNLDLGTTSSIVQIDKSSLIISQVGDSATFVMIDNNFTKLVASETNTNLLDNYLGACKEVEIKTTQYKLKSNTKIVICSDGLTKEVSDDIIKQLFETSDDATYITNKLLNEALMKGGSDNISIITIIIKKKQNKLVLFIITIIVMCLLLLILK